MYTEIPCFVEFKGTDRYISNYNQLCDVIEEGCGHETSELVRNICMDCDAERAYAEQRALTDCDGYEESIWELENALYEISALMDIYKKYFKGHTTLNKAKIDSLMEQIETVLDNNL